MFSLKIISQKLNPQETILVADSLTGQDAASIAKSFSETVSITSSILTRIDGDGRGGAALSIKSITGVPIKFIGNLFFQQKETKVIGIFSNKSYWKYVFSTKKTDKSYWKMFQ